MFDYFKPSLLATLRESGIKVEKKKDEGIMDKPNYILKTNEAVLVSKQNSKVFDSLKIGIVVITVLLILGSFIFKDNLFFELNRSSRFCLIALAMGVLAKGNKKEDVPSPIELQFFDEYVVLYRPKRYYNRRVTRREYNMMKYNEISKCVYKASSKRIHFYADVKATWYNFDKEGKLSAVPTYNRLVKETICYFSTRCALDVKFIREIEDHSPIKVIVENN